MADGPPGEKRRSKHKASGQRQAAKESSISVHRQGLGGGASRRDGSHARGGPRQGGAAPPGVHAAIEPARIPPQDMEAERATLGSMMLEGEAAGLAIEKLLPQDFYRAAHNKVFKTICDICDEGQQPDELIVRDRLEAQGVLEDAGGGDYLHELVTSVPSAANLERYAEIVKEKSVARKLIEACTASLRDVETGGDIGAVLDHAEQRMYEVAGGRVTQDITDISEILKEEIAALEIRCKTPGLLTGIPSGVTELDSKTGGFQKSDFIILAARPSIGKTALALTFIDKLACDSGDRASTLLFSLEMSKQQVGLRMLSSRSRVGFQKLRTGFGVGDSQAWDAILERGMTALADAPVFIDDTPAVSVSQLRAKARRMKSKEDIQFVVVDYLQLMTGPRAQSREREVAMISSGLKSLARELKVPLLALSQLRRPPEERKDKRPELMDLRESGALEQDADVVLLLHRDPNPEGGYSNRAALTVAKQRNGPTGSVYLTFRGDIMRFEEWHPESV